MHAACQFQKGITDMLIICQLYSFGMGELHVLNKFVLQAVDIMYNINPHQLAKWISISGGGGKGQYKETKSSIEAFIKCIENSLFLRL